MLRPEDLTIEKIKPHTFAPWEVLIFHKPTKEQVAGEGYNLHTLVEGLMKKLQSKVDRYLMDL